jgi:2,3-bisphosphoglycerate-dependent phosphoglycerate mutase
VRLLRHGESIWNTTDSERNLVARFTGWIDVPLTDKGRIDAVKAGERLQHYDIAPDAVYTSLLKRSIDTYDEIAKVMKPDYLQNAPLIQSWRLNERHYGALVGLSKEQAALELGAEKVHAWRKSWELRPPPLAAPPQSEWYNAYCEQPLTIVDHGGSSAAVYQILEKSIVPPLCESLEDCAMRVVPLWEQSIAPRLQRNETVLIVAHANAIRGLVKTIDRHTMSAQQVQMLSIPSATPLLYSFSFNKVTKTLLPQFSSGHFLQSSKEIDVLNSKCRNMGMTGRFF